MDREIKPQEGKPVSSDRFPLYSWTTGLLYHRIERNYFNGQKDVICRIWKWEDGACDMARIMTLALQSNKDSIHQKCFYCDSMNAIPK